MHQTRYRWVMVAAGAVIGCLAIGAVFSLPVFLRPMSADTGWSTTGISAAMTIGFITSALASMIMGSLSDRFGPRPIVVAGSALMVVALLLGSVSTSLPLFQATFGLMSGLAIAALMAPMMSSIVGWFDTHRSLAVSLVSVGFGVAPMTMSPFAAWLVEGHDWRTSMQVIAVLVAVLMLPAALLIRRPPAAVAPAPGVAEPEITVGDAIRSPQFIVLCLTNFFCCATHAGPIFHTVSYAVTCGIPLMAAVSIYSIEGLAGLGGRVAFGILGDRLGAKRVLVAGLLAQAFGALAYAFVRELAGFYTVAAIFGFIYAGVMPLYAVLARENFPQRMMGTVIGGTGLAGGLGMALGPLAGGLIYDTFATYTWMYVGAWGMGIGATLMAMTFRSKASRDTAMPQPA
ncbi:MFS transporter [Martelella endophytica]|uniref:Membrane protein n=1 Tax=Martelella endophytica TaxID=1486262 RepID=A0A0D5LQS2_MAREN|nr:MFS transporter [Martelella endophytica]AJY46112.1 membrane protein [Martelella endophytica]